jgi:hypothetical protein
MGVGDDLRRVLVGHAPASGSAYGAYLHADPKFRRAADLDCCSTILVPAIV